MQFQGNVYKIHSLGRLLPLVEWTFIFIPILFHAHRRHLDRGGDESEYVDLSVRANCRYSMQRITGMIAFFFIGGTCSTCTAGFI